jgi:hypothetical protein
MSMGALAGVLILVGTGAMGLEYVIGPSRLREFDRLLRIRLRTAEAYLLHVSGTLLSPTVPEEARRRSHHGAYHGSLDAEVVLEESPIGLETLIGPPALLILLWMTERLGPHFWALHSERPAVAALILIVAALPALVAGCLAVVGTANLLTLSMLIPCIVLLLLLRLAISCFVLGVRTLAGVGALLLRIPAVALAGTPRHVVGAAGYVMLMTGILIQVLAP